MPEKGFVSLVGAGPGDPGLITLRALEALRRAEVVVHDALANAALLREVPAGAESVYAGKRAGSHAMRQEEINTLLVERCLAGKRVVRLKGGDPYIFGRGGEEALALREADCPFEVIPGVTAASAASACAGIPLTHRGLASAVTLVTGHEDPTKTDSDVDWEGLARGGATLVFYMGAGRLADIARRLVAGGRPARTPAALVQWASLPAQRTLVADLATIAERAEAAEIGPPALILVGETAALHERLGWFERRPLFGRRVLVTRSRAQAGALSARLEALGARTTEFPVIRIAEPEDPEPLREAARNAGRWDWIVFTSANAVEAFFDALALGGADARALAGVGVAVVGPATRDQLLGRGVRPDLVPDRALAQAVAEAFDASHRLDGKRVLLPRSDIAPSDLPRALAGQGAFVEIVEAYRTVLEAPEDVETVREDLAAGRIDAVTFTSSSTARNFASILGPEDFRAVAESVELLSIGPRTSETLRKLVARPCREAAEHTVEGLVALTLERLAPQGIPS